MKFCGRLPMVCSELLSRDVNMFRIVEHSFCVITYNDSRGEDDTEN